MCLIYDLIVKIWIKRLKIDVKFSSNMGVRKFSKTIIDPEVVIITSWHRESLQIIRKNRKMFYDPLCLVLIAQWEFARPVLKNLKLKLEVRWVLQNWGKTEAFRCFLRKWKSVKNWLRYKQFSDFPNSKIFAGMLKKLAAQLSHCAMPCTRRDMRFSVFTNNI